MAQYGKGPGKDWLIRFTQALRSYNNIIRRKEIQEEWCDLRETSIDELTKLRDSLSAAHLAKNYAEIGGGIVSFIAGSVSVIGQILSIFGVVQPEVSRTMIERGKEGVIFGRLFSFGAKGSEKAFQWYESTKITSILEKDNDNTITLLETVNPTEQLIKVVEEVMSFDVFYKLIMYFKQDRDLGPNLPPSVLHIIQSLELSKAAKTKIEGVMKVMYQSLPSRNALSNFGRNYPFYTCRQLYDDLRLLKYKVFEMSTAEFPTSHVHVHKTYDITTYRGLLNAAWLSLEIIGLCATYQETHRKCREIDIESDLVKKLQECIDLMQAELDIVKSHNCHGVSISDDNLPLD